MINSYLLVHFELKLYSRDSRLKLQHKFIVVVVHIAIIPPHTKDDRPVYLEMYRLLFVAVG